MSARRFAAGAAPDPARETAALESLAADAVERARRAGAGEAEAVVAASRAFTVRASGGVIESLKQSATRLLGLRVIVDGAVGFVSSSDLSPASLDDLAERAVTLARFSTPDEANRLPTADEASGPDPGDLELWDPAVPAWPAEARIALALELERLALAADPRILRTDGSQVSTRDGASAIANSHGVVRSTRGTSASAYVVPLADDRDGKQQIGIHYSSRRHLAELESAEAIARAAVARAVAKVGARRVSTAKVPVVMHPDVAASWLGEMYDAFTGEAVVKRTSWLEGRLGQPIAAPLVTIVDDGRLPRGPGSTAWDGEGVPTRRNVLVDRGTLAMFEYDSYFARRAGTRSTGNAVRSAGSVPGIGCHNLFVVPGDESPDALLARVDRGFYLDDTGSYGFNPVTGDYSFQASGFWIENGAKAYPVDGVTVASTSLEMLKRVVAIANDPRRDGAVSSPTLLIEEMTIGGE